MALSGEKTLGGLIVAILVFLLLAWIVQLTWNASVVQLGPGIPEISFKTALILSVFIVIVGGLFSPRSMIVIPLDVGRYNMDSAQMRVERPEMGFQL
jgi:hypothetical protein